MKHLLPALLLLTICYSDYLPTPFIATAYAPLDPAAIKGMCYSGDPTVTATGTEARVGVIAVDPDVIPLGSQVWVEGFGWLSAEDRGGAIRGQRIDILMASRQEALRWGRREVRINWEVQPWPDAAN